jgi:hypothetical protein
MAGLGELFKWYVVNSPYAVVIVALIVCIVFIEFGHFYHDEVQAVLKGEIVTVPGFVIDWWSMSHFLLFAFIGFVIPRRTTEFAIIGTSWEVFEDYLSNDINKKLVSCDGGKKFWCHGFKDSYWYGKWDDILMNIAGYIVGNEIRTRCVSY